MNYAVVFAPEAEDQLAELYHYIAAHASSDTAARYTNAIVTYCEGMSTFPHRGTRRKDIRTGLRITNYKGSSVIAFDVDDDAMRVSILGIYYGGQEYKSTPGASPEN